MNVWVFVCFIFSRLVVLLWFILVRIMLIVFLFVCVVVEWNSMLIDGWCWFIGGLFDSCVI